jgi:hypothetical protein
LDARLYVVPISGFRKNKVLLKFNLNKILFTVVTVQSLKWTTYWWHVLYLVYKTQPISKPGVLGDNLGIKRDHRVKFTNFFI